MSAPTANLVDIKGHSLDDGPGIRSVVFFKGCPLSCAWCHNPEAQPSAPVLSWDQAACLGFQDCGAVCPTSAVDQPFSFDRSACTSCMACTEVCETGALSEVGQVWTVPKALRILRRYERFHTSSGGGVTLSGGEPTLHPTFARALLMALKEREVHTLVETSGHFAWPVWARNFAPHVDAVYVDLKLIDEDEHRHWCGMPNDRILDNIGALVTESQRGGPAVTVRVPLIPGITTRPGNLIGIASFLRDLGVPEVTLLRYNAAWRRKAEMVGLTPRVDRSEPMNDAEVATARTAFGGFHITS